MKQILLPLWVLCSFLYINTLSVWAGDVMIGSWPAQGYTKWRIEFPIGDQSTTFSGHGASELYYPQQGSYLTARYKTAQNKEGYFSAEGGYLNRLRPGKGYDTDWDYTRSDREWYLGEFQSGGTSSYLTFSWHKPVGASSEVFFGYSYRNSSFQMTDGLYSIYEYQPVNISLPTLASTYTLTHQGPHIGAATTKKLSSAISIVGAVTYSPLAAVRGHGYWNLRDLDFVHSGLGHMVDTQLGLRYNIPKSAGSVTLSYQYRYMDIYKGGENTSRDITWVTAATVQEGMYVSGEYRF